MINLINTRHHRAHRQALKELKRDYKGTIPSLNFNGPNNSRHSIFVTSKGVMHYLVTTGRGSSELFQTEGVRVSRDNQTGTLSIIVTTPFSDRFILMDLFPKSDPIAHFITDKAVQEFGEHNKTLIWEQDIADMVYQYAMEVTEIKIWK
jgi:hypothetical protein